MENRWEVSSGPSVCFVTVNEHEVCWGDYYPLNEFLGGAGSCSHQEFLTGIGNAFVLQEFGAAILDEVIALVKAAPEVPEFKKAVLEFERRKSFLEALPLDDSMRDILKLPDTIKGSSNLYNADSSTCKSIVKSTHTLLVVAGGKGYVEHPDGRRCSFDLQGRNDHIVELDDHYYILAFNNLVVVSPDGVIVFDTRLRDLPIAEWILGTQLRLNSLYRNGSQIIVLYTWLGRNLPAGLLRFELGKGFTGRCDLR